MSSTPGGGATTEGVADGLRFDALEEVAAVAFVSMNQVERLRAGFLAGVVRLQGVLEGEGVGFGLALGGWARIRLMCEARQWVGYWRPMARGYEEAPVAALGYWGIVNGLSLWGDRGNGITVLSISKLEHQLVAGFGVLCEGKPFLVDATGEAEVG